ncbi:hypothetical protein FRC12_010632 [Ceratobasidium sp. 428]|nr:hypothetical protein FRC12_010632 [Ceratobasidium sp. 428]
MAKPSATPKSSSHDTYLWPLSKIDELISEASSPDNLGKLLGKQGSGKDTSGDTKVKVYDHIAATLFPTQYQNDPKLWSNRVQHEWDYLQTQHRIAANRLLYSGELGVKRDTQNDASTPGIRKVELQYYMPPTGPDPNSPAAARNIWEEITQKFPQFPRMHEILSTRPNQVPIAVTTALTPFGPETVLLQPPSDSEDGGDVEDNSTVVKSESGSLTLTPAKRKRTATQSPTRIRAANRVLDGASVADLRWTAGLEDQFFEVQKQIQSDILKRDGHARQLAERQQVLQGKRHLLEEFKLGLITVDEYRAAVSRLMSG